MGRTYSENRRADEGENYIKDTDVESRRKETTWKTETKMH
jgi:hypothetical protein